MSGYLAAVRLRGDRWQGVLIRPGSVAATTGHVFADPESARQSVERFIDSPRTWSASARLGDDQLWTPTVGIGDGELSVVESYDSCDEAWGAAQLLTDRVATGAWRSDLTVVGTFDRMVPGHKGEAK